MVEECTAVACYLEKHGGLVSFPLVTVAGLADGVNPCAIGMMVMLLGYLIVFAKKPEKVVLIGTVYIATVFATYLIIGLAFYSVVAELQQVIHAGVVNRVVGTVLGIAALIMLKDVVWPESPIHLRIPGASKEALMKLIEKVSIPGTVALGVAVTVLETPCSLPLYVGTATVLAQSGLPLLGVVGYFAYYNLLFVLPLVVVLVLVWKGKKLVEMREWEHKAEKWMKLSLGVILGLVSMWLLVS
ncbi:MAG: GAP family protein [Candidatus Chisholmbacteria bacterium]|nr:GAP family protein [Candidatus Chisholmbacteria bacterium]